jgi:uncharacterized phage infection (PIP) family protein YhgE
MRGGQEGEFDAMNKARSVGNSTTNVTESSGEAKITQALASLAAAKADVESSKSVTNTIFGGLASLVSDVKSPSEQRAESLVQINAEEERLKKTLAALRASAEQLNGAMQRATGGTDSYASSQTTRGPLGAPASRPGTAPAGG